MKNKVSLLTIFGLVLGIICGVAIPEVMKNISFIGTIYINLLKFMIMPIIITSIAVTIFKSKNLKGRLILKTVGIFTVMFVLTFLITSIIVSVSRLGVNAEIQAVEWAGKTDEMKFSDVLVNLFPSNMITMLQNNSIFAGIIFAVVLGISATKIKNGEHFISFIEELRDIFFKMTEYIMKLTPIAVFSLIGTTIANYGNTVLGIGLKYIGMAYLCCFIALFFVMILPVWIFAKINPITYIKNVWRVWIITLTTCSSVATLPTTIKTCNEKFGISSKITDIVVPLGCTIHMCGGAVSFALLGMFCVQFFNISLTPILFVKMVVSATLINMAAPGIPNGGIIIGATFLSMFGIPLEFIGVYSGMYKFLDMAYTSLNVTGDISANILINKFENEGERNV